MWPAATHYKPSYRESRRAPRRWSTSSACKIAFAIFIWNKKYCKSLFFVYFSSTWTNKIRKKMKNSKFSQDQTKKMIFKAKKIVSLPAKHVQTFFCLGRTRESKTEDNAVRMESVCHLVFLERSSLPRVRRWKVERWGLVRKKWNRSSKRKPVNRLWNARKPVVRLVYSHPSRLRKKAQTREET